MKCNEFIKGFGLGSLSLTQIYDNYLRGWLVVV